MVNEEVDLISSDHSPASPDLKAHDDFFDVWGGISGVGSTLQVLLTHREQQELSLERIVALTSTNPAERFGFRRKGRLEPGFDADLCLVDLDANVRLESKDLFYKHKLSPYVGQTFCGEVKQTLLRGQTIFKDGNIVSKAGHFIRPERSEKR